MFDNDGNLVREGDIRFAQIEYGQNIQLCKAIGNKKLSFVQLYKTSSGKIDELVCGPHDFKEKIVKQINLFLASSVEEPVFQKNMEDGQALSDGIMSSINDSPKS